MPIKREKGNRSRKARRLFKSMMRPITRCWRGLWIQKGNNDSTTLKENFKLAWFNRHLTKQERSMNTRRWKRWTDSTQGRKKSLISDLHPLKYKKLFYFIKTSKHEICFSRNERAFDCVLSFVVGLYLRQCVEVGSDSVKEGEVFVLLRKNVFHVIGKFLNQEIQKWQVT